MNDSPYTKARLALQAAGVTLELETAALTPDAHALDPMVVPLLDAIGAPPAQIVDLFCGYGPLGLALAQRNPAATVRLADPSLIALQSVARTAQHHQLNNVTTYAQPQIGPWAGAASDLICANLPDGISDATVEQVFLREPLRHLAADGSLWLRGDLQWNRLVPRLARQYGLKLHEVARGAGRIAYQLRLGKAALPPPASAPAPAFTRRTIDYAINKRRFHFAAPELVFSGHAIDAGTQLLLRFLLAELADAPAPASILDLGCGYGPLGIVLGALLPQSRVIMADQDTIAVQFAARNAVSNGVAAEALLSLGVAEVPGAFDLIVANVPGHIGEAAIVADFLAAPLSRLRPGGAYWLVIVAPLREVVQRAAAEAAWECREIAARSAYSVFCLRQ